MSIARDTRPHMIEKITLQFLKDLDEQGGPPLYTLTPDEARQTLLKVQASGQTTLLPAQIEERTIDTQEHGEITLHIVRPDGTTGTLPGIMYFHGGGWVLGDKETHDRLIREIANGTQATVVFVEYSRSPEAQYPIALEQAYAATVWVAEQGASIGVNTARLAVAGDSVGGNMATCVALLAKERNGPKICYQALFYPVTDAGMNTTSYREYGDGAYWLSADAMQWFWDSYANEEQRRDYHVSPLQASLKQLADMPPALIITDENDVLRDEGEAYAHKLQEAGVDVTATRYLGTIHDFMMLNPIAESTATRAAVAQANAALRKAFSH